MAKIYNQRPSSLLGITDTYTAFCLDEAVGYIMQQLDSKKEPHFKKKYKQYTSFSDLYKQYEESEVVD